MGKTTDLFKKDEEIKGTFHAKMGTIKERNIRDLTEAEESKRSRGNTQKNLVLRTKKVLVTQAPTMMWSLT